MRFAAASMAFLLLVPAAAEAQRADAQLACRFTGTDFIYDCDLRLTRGGVPVSGAQVVVSADMPAMRGMHPMAPVRAVPGATPGTFSVRLDVEMTGEWEITLRLGRETQVLRYLFDEKGARPAGRAKAR